MIATLATLGLLQFLNFLMATVDIRAIAMKKYWMAVMTNASIPMLNFAIITLVGEQRLGLPGALSMGIGGALSAVVGIYLTRNWRHHDSDAA